ncbi:hypothetical protein HER39_08345, partial [Arthrobacter deserti]|nr:hypothetical protein [Arthrobacter deserti]
DFQDRPRRDYGDRPAYRGTGPEEGEWTERPHSPRDLRSSNRADRPKSPDIDEDVTGAELDRVVRAQLKTLESKNAEWVSK